MNIREIGPQDRRLRLKEPTGWFPAGRPFLYVSWLNSGPTEPILTLRYFEPLIEEVLERPFPPGYREYMRLELEKLSSLWREKTAPRENRTSAS